MKAPWTALPDSDLRCLELATRRLSSIEQRQAAQRQRDADAMRKELRRRKRRAKAAAEAAAMQQESAA